ncbi:MAG: GtrA family protein [Desulfovibrio sp.]|uniref:GtrA family protein n=1 Tax=Desulfovibrio sp. TaxID=885 RepID=UPI0039E2A72E
MSGLRPPCLSDLTAFVRGLLGKRWIRFGMVGGAATLTYVLLGLLFVNLWGMHVLMGNALAYALSFIVSYLGQSLWTFGTASSASGLSHWTRLARFAAAQALGLGLNSAIIWLLMRLSLTYEVAMPVAVLLVPVMVYLLCKYWVFRQNTDTRPSTQAAPQTPSSVHSTTNEERP